MQCSGEQFPSMQLITLPFEYKVPANTPFPEFIVTVECRSLLPMDSINIQLAGAHCNGRATKICQLIHG